MLGLVAAADPEVYGEMRTRLAAEVGGPAAWDGGILVPFPVESQLSGVQRAVGAEQRLW